MNWGEQPSLPYPDPETGRTSGHAGSDTSKERAHHDDRSGRTSRRQAAVLRALDRAGERGLTWRELADLLSLHHGQASGSLSNLHTTGRIARLEARRNRCKIYVLPEHVAGRVTEAAGQAFTSKTLAEAIKILDALGPCTFHRYPEPDCLTCRARAFVIQHKEEK